MVAHLKDKVNTFNIIVSDEAKASGLMCSFILENDTIFYRAKMSEIVLEYFNLEVVGKPTYEYFAKLGIYFISLGY